MHGQVGLVRSISWSETSSGNFTVQPSAIWSMGPKPLTRLRRIMVTGISALVVKWEEKPPPRKLSNPASHHTVASVIFLISSSVTSHHFFMTALPFSSVHSPQASRQAAPELSRWIIPPFSLALPENSYPVTRLVASGDQNVRTSAKICARFVNSLQNSMPRPFNTSFSVAKIIGSFFPSKSKDEFKTASG